MSIEDENFPGAPNDATKLQIVICEDTSLLAGGGVVATVGGSCRELARAVTGRSSQLGTFPARACAGDDVSVWVPDAMPGPGRH